MRCFLFAVFITALVIVSCKLFNDPPDSTASMCDVDQQLIGNWKGIAGIDTFSFSFSGTEYAWREGMTDAPQTAYELSGTYCPDTTVAPHNIDLSITRDSRQQHAGQLQLGIYAISGDTLRFAAHTPGNTTRPTQFDQDVTYTLIRRQ